jgi:hypothetical protein
MSARIRKGMWVRFLDRTAIVAGITGGETELHLVDANGATETVVIAALSSVYQCAYDDIPAARRPTPDAASALGYL